MAYSCTNLSAYGLRLSGAQHDVLGVLLAHYNKKTREAFPALTTIAALINRDKSHVVRILRELEVKKLVTKMAAAVTGRKSNSYVLSSLIVPREFLENDTSTASKRAVDDVQKTVARGESTVVRGESTVVKRVNLRSKKGEPVVTLTYKEPIYRTYYKNLQQKNAELDGEQACPSSTSVEVVAHATAPTKISKPEEKDPQVLPLIAESITVTKPKRIKPKAAPPSADVWRVVDEMRKIYRERMPGERLSDQWQARNINLARKLLEKQGRPLGEVLERMERCDIATHNIPNAFTDLGPVVHRWEKWAPGRNEAKTRPGYQGKLEDAKPEWDFGYVAPWQPLVVAEKTIRSFSSLDTKQLTSVNSSHVAAGVA